MPRKKRKCKIRKGPKGGSYYVQRRKRKHGGGVSKVYVPTKKDHRKK